MYAILNFKIIDISNDSYVQHKALLFLLIFAFQFCTTLIVKVKNNCKINIQNIIDYSLKISIASVIGYTLYVDLNIMESTKEYMQSLASDTYMTHGIVTIFIICCIVVVRVVGLLFGGNELECTQ